MNLSKHSNYKHNAQIDSVLSATKIFKCCLFELPTASFSTLLGISKDMVGRTLLTVG